jgi:hypothetical protein
MWKKIFLGICIHPKVNHITPIYSEAMNKSTRQKQQNSKMSPSLSLFEWVFSNHTGFLTIWAKTFSYNLITWLALFLKVKRNYIRQASCLIKNLPVPLDTLVRKRVRLKLAAENHTVITSFTRLSRMKLGGSSTQLQVTLEV